MFPALGVPEPPDAWHVRSDQPMCLNAVSAMAEHCSDPDKHLFPALQAGVPTGFQHDISPSGCFWEKEAASGDTFHIIALAKLQMTRDAQIEAGINPETINPSLGFRV